MAVKTIAAAAAIAWMVAPVSATAQSLTAEAAVVAGYSTDDLDVEAAQARVFGDIAGGVRYFGELAWARSANDADDAFATAFPYGNRVDIVEAYAEKMFRPGGALLSVRGGRFRPPFGIYNASDHAYNGFLRPPLVRYGEYAGVSNYLLEQGADVTVGMPWLTVETALGAPGDVGDQVRRSGLDTVTRAQAYFGRVIAGASYIRTRPIQMPPEARDGLSQFTGADLRWAAGGWTLRGEWMRGHPFEGATANGWYADVIVHLIGMGLVTAVARVEHVAAYDPVDQDDTASSRETIGGRMRLPFGLALTVNLAHRSGQLGEYRPTSLDVGVMWSGRRGVR